MLRIYTSPPPWWRGAESRPSEKPWWKDTCAWRSLQCLKACVKRPIGGHYAVTRSLLAGLKQNGVPFSYNSPFLPSGTVLALAGLETLKFAIEQKKAGRIRFLAAGPNICVLPSQCDFLVADTAVDLYLVNSEWTLRAYAEDCPVLRGRLAVWPAGVDPAFWARRSAPQTRNCLLYVKSEQAPLAAVKDVLRKVGITAEVIRYGEYDQHSFKALLEASDCMIYLGDSESQGIALAEAWAMDVATFV
ncbi:MAG: hypothetical protein DELT_01091 [Desulfovibrio sp.]